MAFMQPAIRILTLASCAAWAQAQTPAEPARLVRLNVLAVESNGKPAAGLTAGDFQVTDQGKPQRITIFREAAPVATPAAAHEFGNRPAAGTHATVILFDFLEQSRSERVDAARKLGPELKQLPSPESVFLYVLAPDGKLVPLHEIGSAEKNWNGDAEKMLAAALKSQNKDRPAGMSPEDGVKATYKALEVLANQLSAFPGRRDILWITSRVPYVMNPQIVCKADWWDCTLYVPHVIVTMERAGVMVNPFSYIGLGVDESRTLEEMAGLTGGRAYLSQDVGAVLNQFAQPAGIYTIAYAPPADGWDSKFHRVKISCERKGVKLQAKQHYYALPDQRPAAARQQALLVAAYQSSTDVAEIGLRASIAPGADANHIRIALKIDASDFVPRSRLTLLYSPRAAAAPQGEPTLSDLDVQMTPEMKEFCTEKEYPIDSATAKVRLIVIDRAADSVGSLTIPVGR